MEQHLEALALANKIRLGRSAIKKSILAAPGLIYQVLSNPPECVRTMTITELLEAQRRWGGARAHSFLNRCGILGPISQGRMVGNLTAREREEIIERLKRGG